MNKPGTLRHLWTWLSWRGKSKLPNEHPLEHTVCSNRQSKGGFPVFLYSVLWQFHFHCKFHVSRSGVRIPVKAIFVIWLEQQLILVSRESYSNKYSPLIGRCRKLRKGKKSEKMILTGIRTPGLETWNLKWNWNCHSMLYGQHPVNPRCRGNTGKAPYEDLLLDTVLPMGCSLGSLLFLRQDNHVQRRIHEQARHIHTHKKALHNFPAIQTNRISLEWMKFLVSFSCSLTAKPPREIVKKSSPRGYWMTTENFIIDFAP